MSEKLQQEQNENENWIADRYKVLKLMLGEIKSTRVIRGEGRQKIVCESEMDGVLVAKIKLVDDSEDYLVELKIIRDRIKDGAIFPIDIPYCNLSDRGTDNEERIYIKREDFGTTIYEKSFGIISKEVIIKTMINLLRLYDTNCGFPYELTPKNLVFKNNQIYPIDISYSGGLFSSKNGAILNDLTLCTLEQKRLLEINNVNIDVYSKLKTVIPQLERFFEIKNLEQNDIDNLIIVLESNLE